jgi:hypothetical protein
MYTKCTLLITFSIAFHGIGNKIPTPFQDMERRWWIQTLHRTLA